MEEAFLAHHRALGRSPKTIKHYRDTFGSWRRFLAEWIRVRGDEPGSLFWLKPAGIRMLFNRIKADCGVDVLTLHQIRHTAATHMVRANLDLHSVWRCDACSRVQTALVDRSLARC